MSITNFYLAPSVSASIGKRVPTPQLGKNFGIRCIVSGAENLDATVVYQWTRSSEGTQIQVGTSSSLSFTPLRVSNAASYMCKATILSSYTSHKALLPWMLMILGFRVHIIIPHQEYIIECGKRVSNSPMICCMHNYAERHMVGMFMTKYHTFYYYS